MTGVPRTIRARITLIATVLCAGLLLLAAVVMIATLRWQLTDNLDEGLLLRADTIAAAMDSTTPAGSQRPMIELGGDEDLLVQFIAPDGKLVAASPNLGGAPAIAPLQPGVRTLRRIPPSNETFRVVTRPVRTPVGEGRLIVGVNYDDVSDPLRLLTRTLAATVPAVVVVLAGLTWWLTGRTLRPVERMRVQMAEISESNLHHRVPEPNTGDEIARLARTMNQTLDRLEDAVRRQQRFVADASHELRGPLTRLRGQIELGLAHPGLTDRAANEAALLDETVALQHLVDDLLHLARSDAGATELTLTPIDLDDIVLREARRLHERGRIRLDAHAVSAAHITGDAKQLSRAVRNLFDNAERHAASAVTVSLGEIGGVARLTVSDDGAGVAADQREHVFERFTRLDEGRTRDAGGSGLGLAIARDIVLRHAGTIRIADEHPTTFVVEIPIRI